MTLEIQVNQLNTATTVLIEQLHLQVPPGVIHTVMGPSGSGKSSLLAAVCGTLADGLRFNGAIALNGRRLDTLPTELRRVGILFQDDLLFPHMTVFENLLFAVPPGARAQRRARVTQALHDLEMPQFADTDPATLSGGQRARVALMRALLAEPRALLLDEPFSRLDTSLRERMRGFVFERVRQQQIPVLLVTHEHPDNAHASRETRLAPGTQAPPTPTHA
jgi:putative thiamine transport system ATP-binding protein